MKEIAEALMQIGAVKLQSASPFTWASGWISPIYCDNRKALSHSSEVRKLIYSELIRLTQEHFGKPDVIVGVATGAIA